MSVRVALLADYLEEGWTSMDHYASMLVREFGRADGIGVHVTRPGFRVRFAKLSRLLGPAHGRTLDRYFNRYWDHPREVAKLQDFDLFHIVDQTYAHSVGRLPASRTIVTCHDLDFAEPPLGTRHSWLVRATGGLALRGLRTAARVICDSDAIRKLLLQRDLVLPDRVSVVPLGVEQDFQPVGPVTPGAKAEALLMGRDSGPLVLHVGGVVVRKRLDVLLDVFARIRKEIPNATLIRVGGPLSADLHEMANRLGIRREIVEMPFLTRAELAAVYRRADLFLLTSDTEGFALPVLEAMASGLPVVATELPAVRELGGDAILQTNAEALAEASVAILKDPSKRSVMRERGRLRAAGFSWQATAEKTRRVYDDVLGRLGRSTH